MVQQLTSNDVKVVRKPQKFPPNRKEGATMKWSYSWRLIIIMIFLASNLLLPQKVGTKLIANAIHGCLFPYEL